MATTIADRLSGSYGMAPVLRSLLENGGLSRSRLRLPHRFGFGVGVGVAFDELDEDEDEDDDEPDDPGFFLISV